MRQDAIDARVRAAAGETPYPLIFATVSGAHLYGFPSADSDYDLRASHVLPAPLVLGLDPRDETVELWRMRDGIEVDLVSHDVAKFFRLLLKNNGYVLEQLYSPLVVQTSPEHEELKEIARGCITRHHAHHYLGFARTQWRLFEKEAPPRVKPLLYTYRVLLTGLHLMRTGEIEANLPRLNDEYGLPYIEDLVARKLEGTERAVLGGADTGFHRAEYDRLCRGLEEAHATSALPESPSCRASLDTLLVRIRLDSIQSYSAVRKS